MSQDIVSIARAVYDAYERKDRSAIEALIAEDFHFTSPLDNRLDRETYFARCWPNSRSVQAFEFIHIVPSDDRVFVTYVATNTDGHRFRNTEVLTVREGKLVDAEVYFGWTVPHKARAGGFVSEP
jgi:ketosteroid isomerase-like protein